MPNLLDSCVSLFGTENLYDVISVPRECKSQSEIKRGYYRQSLKCHPDKVCDSARTDATEKFQVLGQVYSILSDSDKKRLYDDSGVVDDEDFIQPDYDWSTYWRLLFAKVTEKDIIEFQTKYQGSSEEMEDLRSSYVDFCGNMDRILESIMCATVDDEERFYTILTPLIDSGQLPRFDEFYNDRQSKSSKRKKRAQREAREADELKAELGLHDGDSLVKSIQTRMKSGQNQLDDFISNLEKKYSKNTKSASGKNKKGKSKKL